MKTALLVLLVLAASIAGTLGTLVLFPALQTPVFSFLTGMAWGGIAGTFSAKLVVDWIDTNQ